MAGIDKLIINSAYREPEHHWKYDMNGQTFVQEPGRRPAGYLSPVKARTSITTLASSSNLTL